MDTYTKFINLLQSITMLGKFPAMSPLSKLIFDQIALNEAKGNPLTVRQMISCSHIASPATLHKHLSYLRKSGYVLASEHKDDKRTKYLVLSELGHQYLDALSDAISESACVAPVPNGN